MASKNKIYILNLYLYNKLVRNLVEEHSDEINKLFITN